MNSIELLQIGDMHFDDSIKQSIVDNQDPSYPEPLVPKLTVEPFRNVFREIAGHLTAIDGILICGDLASSGNKDEYKKCVDYLFNILNLDETDKNEVHIVPGNHDVFYNYANDVDIYKKFEPIDTIWKSKKYDILPKDKHRSTTLSNTDASSVRVYSVNSCLGCGEVRHYSEHYPPDLRNKIKKLIEEFSKNTPDDSSNFMDEVLNSPLIAITDIDNIHSDIKETIGNKIMPIILAHHNLLPQAISRTLIYAEMMNSGIFRTYLTGIDRPIIYCHGHIHMDHDIEVVINADVQNSKLILISAPSITEGFNLIRIIYSRANLPIGLMVKPYRFKIDKGVVLNNISTIPFYASDDFRKLFAPSEIKYLDHIKDDFISFNDLVECVRINDTEKDINNFTSFLKEAHLFKLIEIYDKECKPEQWKIKRLNL